jgi:hypothetical protein
MRTLKRLRGSLEELAAAENLEYDELLADVGDTILERLR